MKSSMAEQSRQGAGLNRWLKVRIFLHPLLVFEALAKKTLFAEEYNSVVRKMISASIHRKQKWTNNSNGRVLR
jgi:hypothetical protein